MHIQGVQAQRTSPRPTATPVASPTSTNTADESDASPSAETSKETIEEIKRRIEKNSDLVKGVTDPAQERIGLIGEVMRITGESLTVKTNTATVIMALTDSVRISSGNKTIKATDIAVGNWVSIIGTEVDDAFTPKTISVSTESLRPKTQEVALGTITEISRTEIAFTPRGSEDTKTVTINRTSTFEDSDGTAATVADFETDMGVLLVAQQDEEDLVLATLRSLVPLEE